jgi:hypothetical protein
MAFDSVRRSVSMTLRVRRVDAYMERSEQRHHEPYSGRLISTMIERSDMQCVGSRMSDPATVKHNIDNKQRAD